MHWLFAPPTTPNACPLGLTPGPTPALPSAGAPGPARSSNDHGSVELCLQPHDHKADLSALPHARIEKGMGSGPSQARQVPPADALGEAHDRHQRPASCLDTVPPTSTFASRPSRYRAAAAVARCPAPAPTADVAARRCRRSAGSQARTGSRRLMAAETAGQSRWYRAAPSRLCQRARPVT